jgi:hypothetical protein
MDHHGIDHGWVAWNSVFGYGHIIDLRRLTVTEKAGSCGKANIVINAVVATDGRKDLGAALACQFWLGTLSVD